MRKAGKAVQKLLSGQFSELADRGREVLQRRHERQHHQRRDSHFANPTRHFTEEFLDKYRGADGALNLVAALRDKVSAAPFAGLARSDTFTEQIRGARPEEGERIIKTADQICANRFPIFSLEPLDYGEPPQWNADPVNKKKAAQEFYADIDYLNAKQCGDSKIVWEPARFQFVYDLGQAYLLTKDERYARKFFELVVDWSEAHPDYQGIGFCSVLEFAFRIHSLLWGIHLFRDSESLNEAAATAIYRICWLGAHFTSNHLSVWFSPNTHLLGEAYGLFLVGTQFPEFRLAADWKALGEGMLLTELDQQFTADGMHAELSTAYHAYAMEFYLSLYLLAKSRNEPWAELVREKVLSMTEVLAALQRPDGTWPHVGDEDGGRLYFLSRLPAGDYRPLLEAATLALRDDSPEQTRGTCLDSFWLTGADLMPLEEKPPEGRRSRHLEASGFLISRDPAQQGYVLFQHGAFGHHDAPHSHADMLQLDLSVGNDNFLVDPGTFVYTADLQKRNRFRSASAHNGPNVAGADLLRADAPFGWQQMPDCRCARSHSGGSFDICEASYELSVDGKPVKLTRGLISLGQGLWLIWDRIAAPEPLAVNWNFISPFEMVEEAGQIRLIGREGELLLAPLSPAGANLEVGIEPAEISEDYLSLRDGRRLRLSTTASSGISLYMLMQWQGKGESRSTESVNVKSSPADCYWSLNGVEHHLLLGVESEEFQTDAAVAYVRREQGQVTRALLVEGSKLSSRDGVLVKANQTCDYLDAQYTNDEWLINSSANSGEVRIAESLTQS
jgi:hypothetical protein